MRVGIDLPPFGPLSDARTLAALAREAGVTWWQEGFWYTDTPDIVRERIRQGPPKL